MDVPGDDDSAFDVLLDLRPLLRHLVCDPVVDVVVQLFKSDVAVAVQIGLYRLKSFDKVVSEDGPGRLCNDSVTFEGVLGAI